METPALVFYACAAVTAVFAFVVRRLTVAPQSARPPRHNVATWPHPTAAR